LSAQIDRIDDLGRARFARLRIGDVKFAARVPAGFAVPADQVGLIFDTSHVHVYADSHLVEGAP
jgi:glycerol transport system ATP-binding protein